MPARQLTATRLPARHLPAARNYRAPLALLLLGAAMLAVGWPLMTRPFWYDEQWRAYHVALGPDQWSQLKDANAPMAAGWLALEQLTGAVFGLREWALRLPAAAALLAVGPSTYLLGRWWLSHRAAFAAGALVTLNGELFIYGLQLKPYLLEAALTPLAVHTWLCARRARDRGQRVWPAYLGLGGIALVSLPGVFLLAPLLAWDAVEALRSRTAGRLAAPVAAGAVTLLHLATAVRRQSYLVHDTFWQHEWIRGPGQALGQLVSYVGKFPLSGLTEPDDNPTSPFQGSPLITQLPVAVTALVALVVGAMLIRGLLAATTGPVALQAVSVTLVGAVALITVAAAADIWPAGSVRVNVFLLPLLSLVAVTGALRLPLLRISVLAGAVFLAAGARWTYVAGRSTSGDTIMLGAIKAQQQEQRADAEPGDLAIILVGRKDFEHYTKGAFFYSGNYPWGTPGTAIPPSQTFSADGYESEAVTSWLGARRPHALFVSVYDHVLPADSAALTAELRADGWCTVKENGSRLTGTWAELTACG